MSPTAKRQIALQGAAVIFVLSLAWPYYGWQAEQLPWLPLTLAIGAMALAFATLARQAWWWRIIHAVFMPLVWLVHSLAIDPGWFLFGFILLLLVYRGALTGQVPLYLSNRETVAALDDLLGESESQRFIDLGAGVGSTVRPLAERWPARHFAGVENAPGTWLGGRLLSLGIENLDWRWGDFWETPLADFDLVYAFLSPVPMAELWEKASKEMRPGSLFVSNSFPVPGISPERLIEVDSTPQRVLYCYRIPA
ncbi:MAG: class I SAM-dependent methyltransferase [Azonexus sp.]|nr:class I SAM-dependent methyltransferase [Azonexus sp.]